MLQNKKKVFAFKLVFYLYCGVKLKDICFKYIHFQIKVVCWHYNKQSCKSFKCSSVPEPASEIIRFEAHALTILVNCNLP